MTQVLILCGAAATTGVMCCSLYGWGGAVRRLAALPRGTWPMTLTLGLAAVIFLGGLLNLARMAYPWALDTLVAIGLGLAAARLLAAGRAGMLHAAWPQAVGERCFRLIWLTLALLIAGLAAATQLAPKAFNFHDDFQKYFAHVVRMVETGTLAGSPLNTLGSETLGGLAVLDGFIVGNFPIEFINGADGVFCFFLCLLMAGGIAIDRPRLAPLAVLGMLTVVLIDPQYVNVTALYSGAALTLFLIIASADGREYPIESPNTARPATAIGLVCASLVALKGSFALFVGLYGLCWVGAMAIHDARRAWRTGLAAAFWGVLFLSPWLALYAPLYLAALAHPVGTAGTVPALPVESFPLLSLRPLQYGGNFAQYTFLAATTLWCGIGAVLRGRRDMAAIGFAGACVAAAIGYLVIIEILGPVLSGHDNNLRYYVPMLIGTAPAALSLGALLATPASGRRPVLPVALALAIIGWFTPTLYDRLRLLETTGSILAFLPHATPEEPAKYLAFNRYVLGGAAREPVEALQRLVPAGEPILAWIGLPFYLDFKRNPIIDVDVGGFVTPWASFPAAHYVVWQYQGFNVRTQQEYAGWTHSPGRREAVMSVRALDFVKQLQDLAARSQIIVNDVGFVLFRVETK